MAKLTDSQLIVLSQAAARDDGIATIPEKLARAAAAKVGSSLIARKLMRETRSKPGMLVWRRDENDRDVSLLITAAGRKAIGVEEAGSAASTAKPATAAKASSESSARQPSKRKASKLVQASSSNEERGEPALAPAPSSATGFVSSVSSASTSFRDGTKSALVVTMLSAEAGATLDALVDATGWLPHTTRAALTGLRKRGFAIARERQQGKPSVYRIEAARAA